MTDRIIIQLSEGWTLGYDRRQWMLGKIPRTVREGEKTEAGTRFRPVSFIASTKGILHRCIHEIGIQVSPEAAEYIDAMPDTFQEWLAEHD